MMRFWMSAEELERIDYPLEEHFCSPAELGWAYTIDLTKKDFFGRAALAREADAGGPKRRLVGLEWSSEDMAELHAAQYRDAPSAPPPDLPTGQFRVFFLRLLEGGWASGFAYSPTLRRMISLARVGRELSAGTIVQVAWGGFSDEPRMNIRAKVVAPPFIARKRENVL
jgi:glycine cleavage system aminomethyltransferase T